MLRDIRLAFRRFRFHPTQTLLMIVILGMGIGATTAVYSVVDQTILRPAPFAFADRIVDVLGWNKASGGGGNILTPGKIVGWQAQPSLFERFEAYAPREFDVSGGSGEPERIQGLLVSIGLFDMLGVQPRLGRGFARDDGIPGAERVVAVSDALWRRRLGGRDDVLGAQLMLNDEPYTIVAVMPRRFRLIGDKEAVWLPYNVKSNVGDTPARGFYGIARLARGIRAGAEQPLAESIAERLQKDTPLPGSWDLRLLRKKVAVVNDTTRTALFVLLGAVAFVLLITCANTGNLFLSQMAIRQREMAIRTAIGARRGRLLREVLTESILLALCGGAVGMLFATWGVDGLLAAAPENLTFQATSPIEIDNRILAVTATMTLATGLLFGLVPAFRGSRPQVDLILKGSGGTGGRGAYSGFNGALVVAEVAFSLILLVGVALMVRTFANLHAIDPGFEPRGVVSLEISVPTDKYPSAGARAAFVESIRDRIRPLPGVSDVALADGVPPSGGSTSYGVAEAEGSDPRSAARELEVIGNTVTPEFFRALRIPLVAGRFFTDADGQHAIVISSSLAARYWPDGTAVGRRFRMLGPDWDTIVGIAGDVEGRIGDDRNLLRIYRPFPKAAAAAAPPPPPRRRGYSSRTILVRADDAIAVIPGIRDAVRSADSNQPIQRLSLVEDLYADAFARQRFVLQLMAVFGILAATLAAVGLFGVLSQTVVRKTREIGIRMALGARPADVLRLVLSRGLLFAVTGSALGLIGAFALTRFLEALLFGVRPIDPASFGLVTIVMLAIALLACWLPTRRAMRVDPSAALRVE